MNFLKDNKRFSFKLDGVNIWETEYTSEVEEKENEVTTVYYFKDGIKVTNVAKKYGDFDAYEWVNYLENTSDVPTGIISELWDCDCTLPMEFEDVRRWTAVQPDVAKTTKIYAPSGSPCSKEELTLDADYIVLNRRQNHLFAGETMTYAPKEGFSSHSQAPFFNVHKDGKGYIFAVGWSGQWNAEITREHDSLTFRSKVEDTCFKMLPGEKFRTSSVVIMAYEADVTESQNKWRRLVKEHFSLVGKDGRDQYGPLSAMFWGGMKSEYVLERIEFIKEHNLEYDYLWMDAGWYGEKTYPTRDEFEGDWPHHVGDWNVSPNTHPGGLVDVSKAVHDAGYKFLLWFEPERAVKTTPIVSEHPEYFIDNGDPENTNMLLNLGDEKAWDYCFNTVAEKIEKLNIDFYREDFNFNDVLNYWVNNDVEGRKGITEIKFINGFYKFWDALLEKFPHLMIDNCAGGGRKIDIETLRRSVSLWRSDFQCAAMCDIEGSQMHHLNYNSWMPYSGCGGGSNGNDIYRLRSSYDATMGVSNFYKEFFTLEDAKENIELIKQYIREFRLLRPYFSEDFYPLTQATDKTDVWCAAQFNRPEQNDGIVQVFRRDNAPYETATFSLRGLDEGCRYKFTDIDGGEFEVSGKELMNDGFRITVSEKHKAKIYMYKAI